MSVRDASPPERARTNTVWARTLVDALAVSGVRDVVIAPGSRSTPIVLAMARDGRFRMRVHLDERSAAFFALGIGKATRGPAAVVTTSGTAVANLLPAVIEAAQSETPLVLVTADRPPWLRGQDANQTIEQAGVFARWVRLDFDLPMPDAGDAPLRFVRAAVRRAVAASSGAPAGPVHVNVPFGKPLEPVEGAAGVATPQRSERPDIRVAPAALPDAMVDAWVEGHDWSRAVVVAGPAPDPGGVGPSLRAFGARTGLPLLADPLSGARWTPAGPADSGGPGSDAPEPDDPQLGDPSPAESAPTATAPLVVGGYDLLLRSPEAREALAPSAVLRIGRTPTSASLVTWLEEHDRVPQLVLDGGGRWKDHVQTAADYAVADPQLSLQALGERLGTVVDRGWLERWSALEAATRDVLDGDTRRTHEGAVWPAIARAVPRGTVFVSSSMPVRDMDAFAPCVGPAWRVFGNRGASGIDGIVSTAFGVAAGERCPVVCVLGDLAFFHDQNGLLWSREADLGVVFLLIDNDGGGIFHMLPVSEHEPHFTPYFATPHGLDLRHAAALHGIPWRDVVMDELEEALAGAMRERRTSVLRLRTDRDVNRARRAELAAAVADRVRAHLGRR